MLLLAYWGFLLSTGCYALLAGWRFGIARDHTGASYLAVAFAGMAIWTWAISPMSRFKVTVHLSGRSPALCRLGIASGELRDEFEDVVAQRMADAFRSCAWLAKAIWSAPFVVGAAKLTTRAAESVTRPHARGEKRMRAAPPNFGPVTSAYRSLNGIEKSTEKSNWHDACSAVAARILLASKQGKYAMKTKFLIAVGTFALLSASPGFAAQTYSGGAGSFTGLGSDQAAYPGTTFDQILLSAISGIYAGYGTYNINTVAFTAGLNRNSDTVETGSLTPLTGSFDGSPISYSVDYSINISSSDTITLGGNSYIFGGTRVLINPLILTSGGDTATGILSVTTSAVPEPATWAMMIAGFGMIGFGLRSHRKQTVRVFYA